MHTWVYTALLYVGNYLGNFGKGPANTKLSSEQLFRYPRCIRIYSASEMMAEEGTSRVFVCDSGYTAKRILS